MRGGWKVARLLLDIASMKVFVWLLGNNGELLDSHLFFYHRYFELGELYEKAGRADKAVRFFAIAEAHFQAAPDDHPPEAAAAAMPVPKPWRRTNAVSTTRLPLSRKGSSDLVPSLTS